MPGPRATRRDKRPDTGTTNKRAAKRLQARRAVWQPVVSGLQCHFPGSENRKK